MNKKIIGGLVLLFCLIPTQLFGVMSSTNYTIYADTFSLSDTGELTSTSYTLFGTTGEPGSNTTSTGGTYTLRSGFQAAERGILSLTLSGSSIDLGSLSASSVASSSVVATVSTDSNTGYSLAISEDGNLRSGADDIDDVVDGSVTAGEEEYGIITTGTDAQLGSDTAISGSVVVASSNGLVSARQTTIDFRASVSSTVTVAASYSHTVTFTLTVNP